MFMSETSTTYTIKGKKPGLVTLMIDGEAVKQVSISDAETIDLELKITEIKAQ
jgi:hypothetical protein